ncbi:MAG: CHAT domain-containing protein [Bacteroidota bacterium]|jgi:tetratricopeptide (TPR) repeat protein
MKQAMIAGLLLAISIVILSGCGGESPEKKLKDAHALNDKARSLFYQKQYPEAMTAVRQAMSANSELQQDSALTENYLLLGLIQRAEGQYDSTLTTLRYVLERAHLMTNPVIERKGKIALADFLAAMRVYGDAVSLATDAATSSKFFSDWESLRSSLLVACAANHGLGHQEAELKTLRELLKVEVERLRSQDAALVFEGRLSAFAAACQPDSVRSAFEEWIRFARSIGDTSSVARAYLRWGLYKQSVHQYDSSFHAFSKALDVLNLRPDLLLQRRLLCSLGNLAFRQKNFDNAKRYYRDAMELSHKEGNRPLEIMINLQLVACDLHLNRTVNKQNLDEVREKCTVLRDTCDQLGFREGKAVALFFLGRLAERRNEFAAALTSYDRAREEYEQNLLPDGDSDASQLVESFMECEQTGWYEAPLQLQCSVENVENAFELMERSNLCDAVRFFSLLKIATPSDAVNRSIAEVQWRRAGLSLLEQAIAQERAGGKGENIDGLHSFQELYRLRLNELSEAETELAAASASYHWLLRLQQPRLKEIQDKLSANNAVVEFMPLANSLCIVVVRKDSAVMRSVPVNRDYLFSLVNEYNSLISDARLNGQVSSFNKSAALSRTNRLSQMLYTLLVGPVHPLLPVASGKARVGGKLYVVVPKEFGYLPLHTLRTFDNNKITSLGQKFNVSYLPSAAVLLFPSVTETIVHDIVGCGCAGNTSWDVEYELKDTRAFYDKAKLLFDTSATLENLAHLHYDLLQITAEFSLDTARPGNSYVVLSDGATPAGMREIPLGKLLALPPAQTILFSNISPIPGGLFRYAPLALLANGTQTVIATMWQGERKSKKYFGEVFYSNLQLGASASVAYHQAVVALANREEFSPVNRSGLYYQFGR